MALSLRNANCMKQFRAALRVVIATRLRYKIAMPSPKHVATNRQMLKLCFPRPTKTDMLRVAAIVRLMDGQWEEDRWVEHRCLGPSCCASDEDCVAEPMSILVTVAAACAPGVWPRSRWAGAKEAPCWILRLMSMRGLLELVYKVWASELRGGDEVKKHAAGIWKHRYVPHDGTVPSLAFCDHEWRDGAPGVGDGSAFRCRGRSW